MTGPSPPTLLFLVTEDWYFCSHRLALARAAARAGMRVVVATRVARHRETMEAAGLTVIPVRLRRRQRSPWRELRSLVELIRIYRRERPDVVHHVAMKPILHGSIAARLAGVPRVVNAVAGLGYVFTSNRPSARVLRPVLGVALRVLLAGARSWTVVQNPDDAALLAARGIPSQRLVLIPGCGVDTQRFRPAPEPDGPPVVTLVARMLADKGIHELVSAARILRERRPSLRVRLVGPPDPDNPASIPEAVLRGWHDAGVIEWTPGTDDVPRVWAESHIAVLPSYREGLPRSLLEAAACARPIVTTDVPGCRDVVAGGEAGVLVPARDAGALARAIEDLLGDPARRRALGRRARAHVEAALSEDRVTARTLELYEEMLADRTPGSARP